MNTPNGNFIEPSIPNNNATITLTIAGKESTMKLIDFVNAIALILSTPTLQQVTTSGNTTTNNVVVNKLTTSEGITFPSNTVANVGLLGAEPVTTNSCIVFTIGANTYKLAAEEQPA